MNCDALRSRIREQGVSVISIGGYCSFTQPADEGLTREVARFVSYCQMARKMEIPVVRAFAGVSWGNTRWTISI